jgi:hypothetical protein
MIAVVRKALPFVVLSKRTEPGVRKLVTFPAAVSPTSALASGGRTVRGALIQQSDSE